MAITGNSLLYTEPSQPVEVEDISGIPQSDAPPPLLPAFGLSENQWDRDDRLLSESDREWFTSYQNKIDQAALDPDTFYKGVDLSFAEDPKQAQKLATVDAFLTMHNQGNPLPQNQLDRDLFRVRVADSMFGGKGADSDEELFGEIHQFSMQRKDRESMFNDLAAEARKSALISSVGSDKESESNWNTFRESIRSRPGYKPEDEPDLFEAWVDARNQTLDQVRDFSPQLTEVWGAMQQGGAGTFSEVGKALIKDAFLGFEGETQTELSRDDAAATAFKVYDSLDAEDRTAFMDAMGSLARSLPKEDQAKFFSNLAKVGGQSVDDLARTAAEGVMFYENPDDVLTGADFRRVFGMEEMSREQFISARNFASDIRRIERADFDPVKYISKDSDDVFSLRTLESGAYQAPGVFASSALFTLPFVGQALMASSVYASSYDQLRSTALKSGATDVQASEFADEWAAAAAVPSLIAEKLQANAIVGKLPILDKTLTSLSDQVRNRALRGGIKFTAGGVGETLIESGQDLLPTAVQKIADAMGQEVGTPDDWLNGKDGALDGFWTQFATTFVSMAPLALMGAVGGLNDEARARAFAEAPVEMKRALGFTDEAIAKIDAARGQASINQAVDQGWNTREPLSDKAKDALVEVQSKLEAEQVAVENAKRAGVVPQFVVSPAGISVRDSNTGEVIGEAADSAGAIKLAAANSSMVSEDHAIQTAFLGSLIDSAAVTATEETTVTVDPFKKMTAAQQAAISSVDEARILAQFQAIEALDGETSFSGLVLGSSATEFKEKARETSNRINSGASALTVFHEEAHGFYVEALRSGRLTKEETVEFIRAVQTAQASRSRGREDVRLLPDGEVTDVQVDEAVSEFMESEILRKRKSGDSRVPSAIITKNLSAAAQLAPQATKKFSAFVGAVRDFFGVAFARAVATRKAVRDGTLKEADIDAFTSKLYGLNEQDTHNRQASQAASEIIGGSSFSLGSSRLADRVIESSKEWTSGTQANLDYLNRVSATFDELKKIAVDRGAMVSDPLILEGEFDRQLSQIETDRQSALDEYDASVQSIIGEEISKEDPIFESYQSRLTEIDSEQQGLIQDGRAKVLEKLGPSGTGNRTDRKAYNEAVRQSDAKVKAKQETQRQKARREFESALAKREKSDAKALANAGKNLDRKLATLNEREIKLASRSDLSNQRQAILDSLALFDGLLAALPVSIRGKIGGFVTLASLTTDDARSKYLQTRIAKASTVLENYLKKEYGKQFDKLLERAKPVKGKAGEKPQGKAGSDVHALFDTLRQAKTWSAEETESKATALDLEIAKGEMTPEQEAHAILEAGLIRLVGNWKDADSATRAAAVENATRVFESGYAKFKLAKLLQQEDRAIARKDLKADTGKVGSLPERKAKEVSDNGLGGRWKDNFLGLLSFEQVLGFVFGDDSSNARKLADMERQASSKKDDAVQAAVDGLDRLFTSLAGSQYQGERMRWEMAQPSIKVGDLTLSELEAITATLMWRQPDGQRHMIGPKDGDGKPDGPWNYDQAFIDQIESRLSDNAKIVRAHISNQYAAEYATLNPVFRELNGINLPKNDNYSPITVKPQQASSGQMVDPITGFAGSSVSSTPGSLKTRGSAIAEPDFKDALQVFIGHKKQIEHYIAYAPFASEAISLLNNREVGNSVEAKSGKQAVSTLRSWVDLFAQGGNRDAAASLGLNQMLSRMAGRAASGALIGRASVLVIQSTQLGASLAEMPTFAYLSRLSKLFTGQLGWGAAIKSEYIQRRIQQMPPIVRQAMDGLRSTKPNRLKFAVQKIGTLIGGADALFTAGTYAMVYDYQLSQAKGLGLAGAEAAKWASDAAERSTDRVAQPTRTGARSLFENQQTNPFAKLAWSFASEPRQKLMLSVYALANQSLPHKMRAVAVTWVVGGMVSSIIRAATRDIRDDGEDDEIFDEKNWDATRLLLSSLTGPFAGVPVLGDALESAVYKATGEYLPEGNLFSSISSAAKAATDIPGWLEDDPEKIIKDVESILTGLGLGNDTIAASASIAHMARDLFGISQNLTD